MSKKLISLLLTICMLFCLCACGTTEISSNPTNTLSDSQTDTVKDNDENTFSEENSQVSSNTGEINGNETQTQTPINQSKPTSTTNQPTHNHNYSNATCTSPKKCSCGATAGIALGHNYSKATCTSPKKCTRCGVIAETALGHSFSSATCTSPKICVRCDVVSGSALGHKYLDATCISPKICERCDSIAEGALGHDFRNKKCTRCGKLDRTYLIEDIDFLDEYCIEYDKEPITDNQGKTYSGHYTFRNCVDWDDANIEFEISKKYSSFTGTAFLPYEDRGTSRGVTVAVYGDGELLYITQPLSKGSAADTFTIDVKGVSILKIHFENNGNMMASSESNACGQLTNAYLEK